MPKIRCDRVNLQNPIYMEYHDHERGVPVMDDHKLFEFLILEGAQAGLSRETVLNKRAKYQTAYDNFDPQKVAKYTEDKTTELLNNPGIIRNKLKIRASITNAKIFLQIQEEFGSFSDYIWGFTDHKTIQNKIKEFSDYPTTSKISDQIAQDLKKRGMKFVGSTIIYAYMQAIGMVNDHQCKCFKNQC